jgi:TRAP-type C4-dicarboxylate transport system substrate-binding protein
MNLDRPSARLRRWGIVAALLTTLLLPVRAAERIKLATLAPTGSSFHKSLLNLREAWRKASNGGVELVVYADGKLGGEADTVGLMGVNSIQAAMLTAVGLSEIEPAVAGLQSIPMGFHSLAEVDYVGEKLQNLLESRLAAKGFVVLFWSDAGWVRFFAKKPVARPDDLKKMKLFSWSGSADQLEIYRSAGFQPVSLETADILPSLQTGLIEAAPMPPVFALAAQVDTRAPHMLALNWAPLVGACVIRQATWEKLPAAVREEFRKSALQTGIEIKENGRKEGDEAVKAMEKRGLTVTPVDAALESEWRRAAEAAYPSIRGKIVPADIFDEALKHIAEYRARQPGK